MGIFSKFRRKIKETVSEIKEVVDETKEVAEKVVSPATGSVKGTVKTVAGTVKNTTSNIIDTINPFKKIDVGGKIEDVTYNFMGNLWDRWYLSAKKNTAVWFEKNKNYVYLIVLSIVLLKIFF
jgi:hypothetical protein